MSNKPNVSIPSFLYGTAWKEEQTARLTELALKTGFRAIDTANQRKHYFEIGVGEGLAAAYREGFVTRTDLFLQTKYTYQRGQDHRLPYDPKASFATQVSQSLASSLEHLSTEQIDSFVLHGPYSGHAWTDVDVEVWEMMIKERDAGRTRLLGVSNVGLHHLEQLATQHKELPTFVQNRCYARFGWDREVREFCNQHGIIYQGFSLLTANVEVLRHPFVFNIAKQFGIAPTQVIFSFSRQIGMLPMTGTSSKEHMKQDLESLEINLSEEMINIIESIA